MAKGKWRKVDTGSPLHKSIKRNIKRQRIKKVGRTKLKWLKE